MQKKTIAYINMSNAKRGANNPMFGKTHSIKSRGKISESMKKVWAKRKN